MIHFRNGIVLCAAVLVACSVSPRATTNVTPKPDESGQSTSMLSERLFFGTKIPSGGLVSDSAWAVFLAEVVTPRFPSGFTVYDGMGQWTDPVDGKLWLEHTRVIELEHPVRDSAEAMISAISKEFLQRFHQDGVLRITAPVQMRFYYAPKK